MDLTTFKSSAITLFVQESPFCLCNTKRENNKAVIVHALISNCLSYSLVVAFNQYSKTFTDNIIQIYNWDILLWALSNAKFIVIFLHLNTVFKSFKNCDKNTCTPYSSIYECNA